MNESSAISHLATPDFDAIRRMTAQDASNPLVDILRTMEAADERIESLTRQVYALRCAAMKIAWDKKIWEQFIDEEVGQRFRSGDRWLKVTLPHSWRYCREALATILKLPDVPMEKLVNTPRCNIMTLTQVSSTVRALPEVLEAAQTLSEDAFAEKLSKDHGQCLARPETLKFTFQHVEAEIVRRALEIVAEKYLRFGGKTLDTPESRLLAWAEKYVDEEGI